MPAYKRHSFALIPLICVAFAGVAFAEPDNVSRAETTSRAVHWSPGAATSRDSLPPATLVKLSPVVPEFYGVDQEETWIADPDMSIACDASPSFAGGMSCDGSWCCQQDRFWARAEYLYWHVRGAEIPPLVTTSLPNTARDQAGVLNQSTTSVLLGNDRFSDDGQSGGRFSLGFWLDDCRDYGIEFIYTTLPDHSDSYSASSDQVPILARPFFNVQRVAEDSRKLGFPSEIAGAVRVEGSTQYEVYEVLIRRPVSRDCFTPTYIVYGYRSAELDDSLRIDDSSRSLSGATSGATVASFDSFRSRNVFHGFEAGILTDFRISQCWQLNLEGKVAFGETDTKTTILGQTISTNSQGNSATRVGGLLTQQSNIDTFASNSHGVLQDFTIGLQRYMRRGVTAHLGYSIHRWTDVARAGEQIDRALNPTQIPPSTLVGEARPEPRRVTSDFVAQGLTVGLEWVW